MADFYETLEDKTFQCDLIPKSVSKGISPKPSHYFESLQQTHYSFFLKRFLEDKQNIYKEMKNLYSSSNPKGCEKGRFLS